MKQKCPPVFCICICTVVIDCDYGYTTLSGPGSYGNSAFPKIKHYWNLSIRSFCIVSRTLVEGVSLLCRDEVGVFYNPSRLDHRTLVRGWDYPYAEMKSVYSTIPADWATGNSLWDGIIPMQRCSRCILQLQTTGQDLSLLQ